jgi:hypothetical protein
LIIVQFTAYNLDIHKIFSQKTLMKAKVVQKNAVKSITVQWPAGKDLSQKRK